MRIIKILIIACLSVLLTACGTNFSSGAGDAGNSHASRDPKTETASETSPNQAATPAKTPGRVEISFDFNRSFKMASDQLAVWVEDEQGNHIRTLFVTKFTANGGYRQRPESVPNWQRAFQPEQANRAVFDSIASATLQTGRISVIWDCLDQNGEAVAAGRYIYKVEANIEWQKVDLWQGDITVGSSPSQADARFVQGDGSKLQAVRAAFVPSN
ncbi:MAG TPA: DUF2271 domain-containing protein [Selenomonadales bacterium]|nr:DUF2271 domain-containing protein [Selenomonadales bacterium]